MTAAARVGDRSHAPQCAHSCPSCPHDVTGPADSGSPNVLIDGRAALRVGDSGTHSHCCGENSWKAIEGAPGVVINGKPAVRVGDMSQHCGGKGQLVEGSADVVIGNYVGSAHTAPGASSHDPHVVWIHVHDGHGQPAKGVTVHVTPTHGGRTQTHTTDHHGDVHFVTPGPGTHKVHLGDAPSHAHPPAHESAPSHAHAPSHDPAPAPTSSPAPVHLATVPAQPVNNAQPIPVGAHVELEVELPGKARRFIETGSWKAGDDPKMPSVDLEARVLVNGHALEAAGHVRWDFVVTGDFWVRASVPGASWLAQHRQQPYRMKAGTFETEPGQLVKDKLLTPEKLVGGDLEVVVTFHGANAAGNITATKTVPLGQVLGKNPVVDVDVAKYIRERAKNWEGFGDLSWLFLRLFTWESGGGMSQFRGDGTPVYGPPSGYGICQRDPDVGETGTHGVQERPDGFFPAALWDWKYNVDAGMSLFRTKLGYARAHLDGLHAHGARGLPPPSDAVVLREAIRYYNGGYEWVLGAGGTHYVVSPQLPYNPGYVSDVLNANAHADGTVVPAAMWHTQYP